MITSSPRLTQRKSCADIPETTPILQSLRLLKAPKPSRKLPNSSLSKPRGKVVLKLKESSPGKNAKEHQIATVVNLLKVDNTFLLA